MFEFLNRIFGKRLKDNDGRPFVKERTDPTSTGRCSEDEREFISQTKRCPDCRIGGLVEGPAGGAGVNCLCNNPECGSEFNLCFFAGECVFADRNGIANDSRRAWAFGLGPRKVTSGTV